MEIARSSRSPTTARAFRRMPASACFKRSTRPRPAAPGSGSRARGARWRRPAERSRSRRATAVEPWRASSWEAKRRAKDVAMDDGLIVEDELNLRELMTDLLKETVEVRMAATQAYARAMLK